MTPDSVDGVALGRLHDSLRGYRRVIVAYSGGVDSALVARAAHDVLGSQALAVTACSPSLAETDRRAGALLARRIGIAYREIQTHEIDNPLYRANAGTRCYYCKSELYDRLEAIRADEGFEVVLDGTNADDLGDVRPGLQAARERRVASPLLEAGLDKQAVRSLSHRLGLPTWDKPENACLASRLPIGTEVSISRLLRVERAEVGLRELGFRQLRVRDHGAVGRVEIAVEELDQALAESMRPRIEAAVLAAGFERVEVDPRGYRRGGADRA
jgi:uncharacterized protein